MIDDKKIDKRTKAYKAMSEAEKRQISADQMREACDNSYQFTTEELDKQLNVGIGDKGRKYILEQLNNRIKIEEVKKADTVTRQATVDSITNSTLKEIADENANYMRTIAVKGMPKTPEQHRQDIADKFDGFEDADALEIVHTKARKTIAECEAKLRKTKVKKVAIVGTAMTHQFAPYDDPSWEIWGLNDHWNNHPRATRWFECNNEACRKTKVPHKPEMKRIDWLVKCPYPVYMQEHYDDIPMSIKYPWDEVNAMIGELDPSGIGYFTNSVSYMIALAIFEGFDEISLYGVDMAVGGEYEKQRPSCEFFVGIAKGRGIKMYIPTQSDLLKCMDAYGRSTKMEPFVAKMLDRKTFQKGQVDAINKEIQKAQDNIQRMTATKFQYQGSLADIDQTLKVWGQM